MACLQQSRHTHQVPSVAGRSEGSGEKEVWLSRRGEIQDDCWRRRGSAVEEAGIMHICVLIAGGRVRPRALKAGYYLFVREAIGAMCMA